MEVRPIIEDFLMQAIGGMMAAWELWEEAIIPSLLSGSDTCFGKCQDTVYLCYDLHNFFVWIM